MTIPESEMTKQIINQFVGRKGSLIKIYIHGIKKNTGIIPLNLKRVELSASSLIPDVVTCETNKFYCINYILLMISALVLKRKLPKHKNLHY